MTQLDIIALVIAGVVLVPAFVVMAVEVMGGNKGMKLGQDNDILKSEQKEID